MFMLCIFYSVAAVKSGCCVD